MILYNPKDWFSLIFHFHKSDTFRKLVPAMLAMAVYTWLVCFVEIQVLDLRYTSSTTLHSLLGFVISLLLVFRTNTAYDRWWEGRKLWGALINSSRNLAIKYAAITQDPLLRKRQAELLTEYAAALRDHLRLTNVVIKGDESSITSTHHPNRIAAELFALTQGMLRSGAITQAELLVLHQDINALTDICGGCERIRKTPIPYSYGIFIKKFMFAYIMTMPFGFVNDFRFWTILIVVFVFYVLMSLELIAEEIEDPFGRDANDLPTDQIADTVALNVNALLKGDDRQAPRAV